MNRAERRAIKFGRAFSERRIHYNLNLEYCDGSFGIERDINNAYLEFLDKSVNSEYYYLMDAWKDT